MRRLSGCRPPKLSWFDCDTDDDGCPAARTIERERKCVLDPPLRRKVGGANTPPYRRTLVQIYAATPSRTSRDNTLRQCRTRASKGNRSRIANYCVYSIAVAALTIARGREQEMQALTYLHTFLVLFPAIVPTVRLTRKKYLACASRAAQLQEDGPIHHDFGHAREVSRLVRIDKTGSTQQDKNKLVNINAKCYANSTQTGDRDSTQSGDGG